MLILLHGADSFRSQKQLAQIIRAFKKKKNGAVIVIEADGFTVDAFGHHLATQGLFTADKLIILKDIEQKRAGQSFLHDGPLNGPISDDGCSGLYVR